MPNPTRRKRWKMLVPLLALGALGALIFLVSHTPFGSLIFWRFANKELDSPPPLARVSLSAEASLLAWSPDGNYLAAGTGWTGYNPIVYNEGHVLGPAKIFIVDVSKQVVVDSLETASAVYGLAFSPDGKWLAVITSEGNNKGELVVFDVPKFTARLNAKSLSRFADTNLTGEFVDVAWSADGNSLYAIDYCEVRDTQIRHWNAPDFVERPATISLDWKKNSYPKAIAVAPDGVRLAVVTGLKGNLGVLDVFDLQKGTTTTSIADVPRGFRRAVFASDGKTVGVFSGFLGLFSFDDIVDPLEIPKRDQQRNRQTMPWWDVATGKATNPPNSTFAVQPAAQAESRWCCIAPKSRIWAQSGVFPLADNQVGSYIKLSQLDGARTWIWRLGRVQPPPSLAFSPDGTKLAGTLSTPTGCTIALWAIPYGQEAR